MTPLYGGFPVKLTTHLGDWIDPREFEIEELRAETIVHMQKLIKKHQKLPGNVFRAIKERFESETENLEDFIECDPPNVEIIHTSIESLCCEDSGCVSVASAEDVEENNQNILLSNITQLPNGRLVIMGTI